MNDFDNLMHALKPLDALNEYRARRQAERDAIEAAKPKAGLDSINKTFARHAEDYDRVHVFDYVIEGPSPAERRSHVEITGCTLVCCGMTAELPIAVFPHDALEMVREEVEEALIEAAENLHFDRMCERRARGSL